MRWGNIRIRNKLLFAFGVVLLLVAMVVVEVRDARPEEVPSFSGACACGPQEQNDCGCGPEGSGGCGSGGGCGCG